LAEKTDVELVREFKAGSAGAFDAIVGRFQDRIYRLACVWLYDPQNADDATQEVFLRAHKGLRRFHFRAAPFTWLYRTTRYVCNEFNRRRKTEPLDDEPTDSGAGPDRQVTEVETATRVRALVAGLPDRQREVVICRVFEELSVAETASAMGCREGTVKALLHKATQRLRIDIESAGLTL
jgi:RNA polymerase sigma-70 factor (ECF subfamily)